MLSSKATCIAFSPHIGQLMRPVGMEPMSFSLSMLDFLYNPISVKSISQIPIFHAVWSVLGLVQLVVLVWDYYQAHMEPRPQNSEEKLCRFPEL